jgi:predicted nucleic acid-binding protein
MGTVKLADLTGQQLYFDTNIFIYALEHHVDHAVVVDALFAMVDAGQITAVTSEITLAECLVKPFADGDSNLQIRYQAAVSPRPNFSVSSLTRTILIRAAEIRALHKPRLPDAIHLATALNDSCQIFITNDKVLRPIPGIQVLQLTDLTA